MRSKRIQAKTKPSNVVIFPARKATWPPQSVADLQREVEEVRRNKIEFAYNHIFPELMQMIQGMGFHDMIRKEYVPDVALVSDALVSLLEKIYKIPNPMQGLVQRLYVLKKNRDGDVYIINRLHTKKQKH